MKFIAIIPAIITALFVSSAYAKCDGGSKTIFSCITAKGKQIEVCDLGKSIEYSFGKPLLKPEIVVKVPRWKSSTHQWDGVGGMSYTVDIPNGKTIYTVYWEVDQYSEDHNISGGVNVMVNNKYATTVKCLGENIEQNIEGIDLKPTE